MINTKKTILTSLMSLILCLALFISGTLAWFSTSITNTENKITASSIKMNGYIYPNVTNGQDGDYAFVLDGQTYHFSKDSKILNEHQKVQIGDASFNPKSVNAFMLEVKNEGALDLKYRFKLENIQDQGLQDVVWYDLISVKEEMTINRSKHLSDLKQINQIEGTLQKNQSQKYLFVYGLDQSKQQIYETLYKGNGFNFDLKLEAKLINENFENLPKEEEFNNPINNQEDLTQLITYINNGNSVKSQIKQSIALENTLTIEDQQTVKLEISKDVTFNIPSQIKNQSGFNNSSNNPAYTDKNAITIKKGGTLELTGEGVLSSNDYRGIYVEEGANLKINGITLNMSNGYKSGVYGIYSKGNTIVENCQFLVETDNAILSSPENPCPLGGSNAYAIYGAGGNLSITGCNINVSGATNGNTGNGATGIYINGAKDVTISNTNITATGEGTSQTGINCFGGQIASITNVSLDIKGTAIDTREPIGLISNSILKGSSYALYNRSNETITLTSDCTLEGKVVGPIKQQ